MSWPARPAFVVFDCDGTLTDSHHTIVEAMERAFAAVGHAAPTDPQVRRVIGLSLPQAIASLAPDLTSEDHKQLEGVYRETYRAMRLAGEINEMLYPGVRAMLEQLADADVTMAIATGKSRAGLDHVLQVHDLGHFFVSLQTADHNASKPHPQMLEVAMADAGAQPGETVMVGDSPYDILMAISAGTGALGVGWSDHGPNALLDAGAHHMIENYRDLAPLLGIEAATKAKVSP